MSGKRKPATTLSPRESGDEDEEKSDKSLGIDFENATSPISSCSSSTASGPVYERTPGFVKHAHAVLSNIKGKKKKGLITPDTAQVVNHNNAKTRPKYKEPLPMRLRALPQSFWQQPNVTNNASPANIFPVLPPLFNKEPSEDIAEVRPVTPTEENESKQDKGVKKSQDSNIGSRTITVGNTDLLYRLFDKVSGVQHVATVKRGRPKKTSTSLASRYLRSEDPCMIGVVSENLLPLLPSADKTQGQVNRGGVHTTLTMMSLKDGDKSVSLPALNVEYNYSQLLSEVVVKL